MIPLMLTNGVKNSRINRSTGDPVGSRSLSTPLLLNSTKFYWWSGNFDGKQRLLMTFTRNALTKIIFSVASWIVICAPSNVSAFVHSFFAIRSQHKHQIDMGISEKPDEESSFSSSGMESLQSRIKQQQNQYNDLFSDENTDLEIRPENVHIIVFNPDTEDQGVHTIEFPKGSGINVILAFQAERECINFAEMLKQDNLLSDPVPSKAPLIALEEFSEQIGLLVKVVPEGRNLRPPPDNVDKFSADVNSEEGLQGLDNQDDIRSWQ